MASRSKLTITDIANKSGVSIATVSRIINNKGNVTDSTRQKVMDVINASNENGQFLNRVAKNPGDLIIVMLANQVNLLADPFVRGISSCARTKGYHTLQYACSKDPYDVIELEHLMQSLPIAGFIFNHVSTVPGIIDKVSASYPVTVGFDRYLSPDIPSVVIDDYSAFREIAEFLISQGRKRFALLNAELSEPFTVRREQAFKDALKHAGLPIREEYIAHVSLATYDCDLARNAARKILNLPEPPDAFMAINDMLAAAILKEAYMLGISPPKDISVTGFDNTDYSVVASPELTTVNQPGFQIGYQACNLLIERINDPTASVKHIVLDSEFVIRRSTKTFGL